MKNLNFELKTVACLFQDLKKYIYYYWFAFPTFLVPTSFNLLNPVQTIGERFSTDEVKEFLSN